ncbi:MAG: hydrogenase formation protein HypD [Clostridium sp.]|nr:hydrogenase formation protein HypD [Clostridium sp.]
MNPLTDTAPWRDVATMRALIDRICRTATRPWRVMEVCGGQTWTLSRYRLEELISPAVTMIHGPGCPVCVTPEQTVDNAVEIARRPDVIFCSFGDMLRVPGSEKSLLQAKADGADIRLLYSPLESLHIALSNPDKQVVFFAIGFETTTPLYALLVERAETLGVRNLSLLTALFTVPATVDAILGDPDCRVDALIAAGHVCAITGLGEYEELARRKAIPVVVGGFEPVDMLYAISKAVEMLELGETGVANAYGRVVAPEGNPAECRRVDRVMEIAATRWRGIGEIAASGRKLRPGFEHFDAAVRFKLKSSQPEIDRGCIAPQIMKGLRLPTDCPHFCRKCHPTSPVGAPMVSAEGVCAAYYRYKNEQP